ncbi:thioredoxin domain-containing protein [Labrys wisconsinensis]|uniref:Uncharacterized protein YyaL (SSP411 family) n=1 Tax=Labrys wisconsinensis TaxID=425677 RepID=A0ABU0J461_9HYPH|nr:thioredoxin domain-containing protein [Labrys wisconsinensis]MDQ0468059.1 uncharacterized protein YyaL (SSP411 family) [Labrys wisconsinensis]
MPALPAHNLLDGETSPYLLQHKDNPVHWRSWGEAALQEARAAGKPILLSIGYAACHWCHVMAHESFENPAIAAVMNELFVNIKVDREERPDVDQIYMAALQALDQPGGWPLTMFLTSDGEPVWGGTYFPPEPRYGRPGFADVLRSVAAVFRDDRARIEQNRAALMAHLARPPRRGNAGLGRAELNQVALRLAGLIDPVHGGPRGAPKFPNASFLELVWRGGLRLDNPDLTGAVLRTLERICLGGIRDHVGGGFARYAVDERWLVPHFEKMLYDNAQLLELLTLAAAATGDRLYADAAAETVGWLQREMMAGDGRAFAASLDADSEGHEGRYYVWTPAEVEAVLGPGDAAWACRHFDIAAAGNWEGVSIPNRLETPPLDTAGADRWRGLRRRLLDRRLERIPPARDDKVLADWNGLMIAAVARAGRHFDREDWLALAMGAYRFVVESMTREGRLGHSWRAGRLLLPGLASDYADMVRAALVLAEITGEQAFLAQAAAWSDTLEIFYADPESGGYFLTASDATALVLRPRSALDEATPNANGVMAENLVRLAALTGEERWRERADRLLIGLAPQVEANVFGHASLLNALDLRLAGAEIVVTGADAGPLHAAALAAPFPIRTVLRVGAPEDLPAGHPARAMAADGPAAFVCAGMRCSLPLRRADEIAPAVRAMRA